MNKISGFPDGEHDESVFSEVYAQLATRFLVGVFSHASNGVHRLVVTAEDGEFDSLIFGKSNGEIHVGGEYLDFLSSMVDFLNPDGAGVTLRSFVSEGDISNPENIIHDDSAHREIRGWFLSIQGVVMLTAQQAIECYCTDAVTGRILDPEPNVAYCDAWNLF